MADLSPIMILFAKWNALRDRSDEPGLDDDEVHKRCHETDAVMDQIAMLPPTDARDFAAKLMCITHYGNYELNDWVHASEVIREAAELVGQPERVADRHREGGAR